MLFLNNFFKIFLYLKMFQKTLKDSIEPRERLKSHLAFDLRPTRSRYGQLMDT